MAKSDASKSPPYVSFTTLSTFVDRFAQQGLPGRIDPSVLSGQSGSTVAALMAAMKYLGFINDDGVPSPVFREYVTAAPEDRGEVLRPILLEAYPYVTQGEFDLSVATPQQVEKAFRDQGITGSTVTKSVGFFLAAAQAAGLQTSSYVSKNRTAKGPRTAGTARPKRKAGNGRKLADPPPPPVGHVQRPQSPAELLLAKFPDFDPNWPEALQKSWFDSFAKLQNVMTPEGKKGEEAS
jgi:hypothetical protein